MAAFSRPTGSLAVAMAAMLLVLPACDEERSRVVLSDGSVEVGDIVSIRDGLAGFEGGGSVTLPSDLGWVHAMEGVPRFGEIVLEGGRVRAGGSPERGIPLSEVTGIVMTGDSGRRGTATVRAGEGWTPVGTHVSPGEVLLVTASGSVSMQTGPSGPSGRPYYATTTALYPGAVNGQLVLRVGDGRPMAADSVWSGTVWEEGPLQAAVNVPDSRMEIGAAGSYEVSVRVVPGPGGEGRCVVYP